MGRREVGFLDNRIFMPKDRRHSAIMFTGIVGYTSLMGSDEDRVFDLLSRNRTIHQTCVKDFNGSLTKEIGDGKLARFSLASDAVHCAMRAWNQGR